MRTPRMTFLVLIGILASGISVSAHHSFDSEFDRNRPIHVEGTVAGIDWRNPHVYVDLDVVSGGFPSRLRVELTSPNTLFREGWTPRTLQPSMGIAVDGFSAKDATATTIGTTSITIKATGQVLNIPSSWHHSLAAEFDKAAPVKLQGTVAKVEWANPHILIDIDTKDDQGAIVHWQCEGASPRTLTRQGWTKDSLTQGDQVTIEGSRAKNGSSRCYADTVTR